MEDSIFCLVGPSGSGKSTVAKALSNDYNVIQSYTTRPPREPGEWGHTFVESYPHEHVPKTIAYNNFHGYKYWATEDQVKGKTIYVIEPAGDSMLRALGRFPVVTIFLFVNSTIAFGRMVNTRGYEKTVDRIKHDCDVFKNGVKTDWVVDTEQPVEGVVEIVRTIIGSY